MKLILNNLMTAIQLMHIDGYRKSNNQYVFVIAIATVAMALY